MWKNIDSAPKDGTRLLLSSPSIFDKNEMKIYCGKYLYNGWVTDGWGSSPTHWQSLPETPEPAID